MRCVSFLIITQCQSKLAGIANLKKIDKCHSLFDFSHEYWGCDLEDCMCLDSCDFGLYFDPVLRRCAPKVTIEACKVYTNRQIACDCKEKQDIVFQESLSEADNFLGDFAEIVKDPARLGNAKCELHPSRKCHSNNGSHLDETDCSLTFTACSEGWTCEYQCKNKALVLSQKRGTCISPEDCLN